MVFCCILRNFVAESVFCDLRCFVAKYISSGFTRFLVEKNLTNKCARGEKMTNMYVTMGLPSGSGESPPPHSQPTNLMATLSAGNVIFNNRISKDKPLSYTLTYDAITLKSHHHKATTSLQTSLVAQPDDHSIDIWMSVLLIPAPT